MTYFITPAQTFTPKPNEKVVSVQRRINANTGQCIGTLYETELTDLPENQSIPDIVICLDDGAITQAFGHGLPDNVRITVLDLNATRPDAQHIRREQDRLANGPSGYHPIPVTHYTPMLEDHIFVIDASGSMRG